MKAATQALASPAHDDADSLEKERVVYNDDVSRKFVWASILWGLVGMAVGAACSAGDSFDSCEQRTQGAFGPNANNTRTITAIGSATSILEGPAFGTLVSVFSIPPTFDATIDSAGDLPGPGAVALPGTASLCSSANPCPEP